MNVEPIRDFELPLYNVYLVETPEHVEKLKSEIEDDEYGPHTWLDDADPSGGIMLAVKSHKCDTASGFIIIDTMFHRVEENGEWLAKLSYRVEGIYVNPQARGRGFARALRRSLVDMIESNIHSLSDRGLANQVRIAIEMECISEEGAAFARALVKDYHSMVDKLQDRRGSDSELKVSFIDAIDYDDYGDEPASPMRI